MTFNSYTETLAWDGYTGDYGLGFSGHAFGASTILLNHPMFGWVSFGGNIIYSNSTGVTVQPKDAVRRRVYVAVPGVYITLDAGAITEFTLDPQTGQVRISLADVVSQDLAALPATSAILKYEKTADVAGAPNVQLDATGLEPATGGSYIIPFKSGTASLTFQ